MKEQIIGEIDESQIRETRLIKQSKKISLENQSKI